MSMRLEVCVCVCVLYVCVHIKHLCMAETFCNQVLLILLYLLKGQLAFIRQCSNEPLIMILFNLFSYNLNLQNFLCSIVLLCSQIHINTFRLSLITPLAQMATCSAKRN